MKDVAKKMGKLDDVTKVASDPGNSHASMYLHGMANGLILAQAIFNDTEPKFITWDEAPDDEVAPPAILAALD